MTVGKLLFLQSLFSQNQQSFFRFLQSLQEILATKNLRAVSFFGSKNQFSSERSPTRCAPQPTADPIGTINGECTVGAMPPRQGALAATLRETVATRVKSAFKAFWALS